MTKEFNQKEYAKSLDFLLEKAGPVIQYRLRKEILNVLTESEEEKLYEQIYKLPMFQLLQSYVKPDGYIGSGMHSWDNWRGTVLHETPLQDGESAARLLSYYRIPKIHPIVSNYVSAMRDEEVLRKEFSYIPPEIPRFENRLNGINNGNCLMALIYTMQAMLGYGDDYTDLIDFQQICLAGFERINKISSLADIVKYNQNSKRKYNYPYIEAEDFFPDIYTLSMLSYTQNWRSDENINMLAQAFNHMNQIMKPDNEMSVRINNKYVAPCFAFIRPIRPFHTEQIDVILYRRLLTEIAMLGVGRKVDVISESVDHVKEALDKDGILRMNFSTPHNKRYSPKYLNYPSAYADVRLETDYSDENALLCDLTFWALEFLYLADN